MTFELNKQQSSSNLLRLMVLVNHLPSRLSHDDYSDSMPDVNILVVSIDKYYIV